MGTKLAAVLLEAAINKWKSLPETVEDLTGRTVIVTGSNVGLGLDAAKRFYAMNPAHLIIAVRTLSKGEDAKQTVLQTGKAGPPDSIRNETKVHVWPLDLNSFESVRSFAKKCIQELERIDVLLENAASLNPGWTVTNDGWESDLQTNVLSTFLLATLLGPLMAKTAKLPPPIQGSKLKPHIVIVASDAHYWAPFRVRNEPNILAAFNEKARYIQNDRYADSKAMDVMMTQELAKSPALKDIVICSVAPGFRQSGLLKHWSTVVKVIMYALFARDTPEGSKTYTWASLTNDIPAGSYTSSCVVTPPGGVATCNDANRIRSQLWKEITAVLIKEAPEVEPIVKF